MLRSTPALAQRAFISAHICRLLSPLPLLVRKISPEAIFLFLAYFISFRHSFPGSRMVRSFPFRAISVCPFWAASTVMYRTSLTRIPVAQMVSIRSSSRSRPKALAVSKSLVYSSLFSSRSLLRNTLRWILRYFTRQSCQPINEKKPLTAESMAFTVLGT